MSQADSSAYRGLRDQYSGASQHNAVSFLVNQILAGRSGATLVKVVAVTNAGELSPVGFVDVQPMVNQLDGSGKSVPHGTVHNLPYFRLQGGANAVILDPQEGDIGLAVFADRDISAVKAAKDTANPGSMRRADMADGLYIGGFLNGVPEQYVQFSEDGIKVCSPKKITCVAPSIVLDAAATVEIESPTVTTSGNVLVGGGASGTFTTPTGVVVTVQNGIVTNIF